ncbi:MAG: N-acetylmuramoyl-L-alanine amidase [Prevotella sp.]|nr:N-acetylmuramoyl-L-alanine amidase [Prevotella sp.]
MIITKRNILMILALALILPIAAGGAEPHKFTLVIDAGHGGRDAGALGVRAKEKNINLKVALAFGQYVERNCPDVKVIYTRKTDVFIPLHKRADIANKNKADVFISIHTNAVAGSKKVTGMETYTMGLRRSGEKLSAAMRENEVVVYESDYRQHYDGFDPRVPESYIIFDMMNETNMKKSVELAKLIQQKTCATAGRPNKGVKQDAFLVLRETSMPACLVELGYITTPSEEAALTNANTIDALGKGIYQAFVAYKNKQQPAAAPAQPTTPTAPEQPATPAAPEQPATPTTTEQPATSATPTTEPADAPVFKVQLMAIVTKLPTNDPQLKGLEGVECFKDGNLWKYTVGSSTDYNAIKQLRKDVLNKFPEAFIIAFKNGEKVDPAAAYQEFKQNQNKR